MPPKEIEQITDDSRCVFSSLSAKLVSEKNGSYAKSTNIDQVCDQPRINVPLNALNYANGKR